MLMEQQEGVQRKLLEEADKRARVWKVLGRRTCGSPSLRAKVRKKDFKASVHSGEHAREESETPSVPPVFALRLCVWEHLGHRWDLSSTQMPDSLHLGQLHARGRNGT